MADRFEPYDHVPQQSRRDKLRVVNNNHHHLPSVPHFDPPLISPDLLTCAAANANVHRLCYTAPKEEGMSLMGFLGGSVSSTNHMYLDDQPQLNPSCSIQDINTNTNPYAYASLFNNINNNNNTSSGQSLSLSLSSHHNRNLPLELCKSAVPLGPFTGYASVLKGSRFLRPAQQLLEELCDMGRVGYVVGNGVDSGLLDPPPLDQFNGGDGDGDGDGDGGEQTRKKSRLLSMLDEVYKRYKQYYQQMQAAVAAFESVAGLSSAAPFANLALKAMSKHFRQLKNAISDQLHFSSKSHGKISSERDENQRVENSGRSSFGQRSFHGSGFIDPPVWRPQRGLPEHAVTVLRAWLFEHFLHPYPTDSDKLMLAKQTGLSRNQVSNWFINARVRLWKPMVEEIHMLETRQTEKSLERDEQSPSNNTNDHLPTSRSIECENPSTSIQRTTYFPSKRTRDDTVEASRGSQCPLKLPYNNLLHNHVGVSNAGGNGGVSLTLGLHQNGFGMSDAYPINAARRFGLDSHGEEYVVSGFTAQNRQFGRGIMDGQIMHDFVG